MGKMKVTYYKSKKSNNRKPWLLDLRPHGTRHFFKTEAEAKAFAKKVDPFSDSLQLTIDQLIGGDALHDATARNFSAHGQAIDFMSLSAKRNEEGRLSKHEYLRRIVHLQKFRDCVIDGKRVGDFKVREITRNDLQTKVIPQIAEGFDPERNDHNGKPILYKKLAQKTVKNTWGSVTQLFKFAVDFANCRKDNPSWQLQLRDYGAAPTKRMNKEERVQPETVVPLIEAMPEVQLKSTAWSDLDWKFVTFFAAKTGIRQGELRALQAHDINLETGKVHIRRAIKSYEGFGKPKNGKTRFIFLDDYLLAELKKYLLKRGMPEGEALIFPDPDGNPVKPNLFMDRIRSAAKIAGVEQIDWHELRHYYAGEMLQFMRLEQVSKLMGHATVGITANLYGHFVVSKTSEDEIKYGQSQSALRM
jgi:integrase